MILSKIFYNENHFTSKQTENKREFKEHINSHVGIYATSSYEKYLGLPALVGRGKN
jgi:hypothetical protein